MTIKMSLFARRELLTSIQDEYRQGTWKRKNELLEGFIAATHYDRKYAIRLLNSYVPPATPCDVLREKNRVYHNAVTRVLETLWYASNQICSKRLVPFIPELVASLERHGHLQMTDEVKKRVLSVSAATLDRVLRPERERISKGLSTTTPGSLLKNQIKVRTFSDWDEKVPGFFEIDLVAHCGDTVMGIFLNTLVLTDIVTTWTECIPLLRKSANDVILGLDTASQLVPFQILGIDADNGCEFINHEVFDYCENHHITFTRSRPYRKNDQAHIEEKNGSIVRRLIGYDRYEGEAAWETMLQLYAILRLYINFFQPTLKLLSKQRVGSKTLKKYDQAQTPYQRVMASKHVTSDVKSKLQEQYKSLDPISLQNTIKRLQDRLWKLAWKAPIKVVSEMDKIIEVNETKCEERFYHRTKKPYKVARKHDWRTRKDPFEEMHELIHFEIQLNPSIAAIDLLKKLIEKHPTKISHKHLRTLQRRVKLIRDEQNRRERRYQELMVDQEP